MSATDSCGNDSGMGHDRSRLMNLSFMDLRMDPSGGSVVDRDMNAGILAWMGAEIVVGVHQIMSAVCIPQKS